MFQCKGSFYSTAGCVLTGKNLILYQRLQKGVSFVQFFQKMYKISHRNVAIVLLIMNTYNNPISLCSTCFLVFGDCFFLGGYNSNFSRPRTSPTLVYPRCLCTCNIYAKQKKRKCDDIFWKIDVVITWLLCDGKNRKTQKSNIVWMWERGASLKKKTVTLHINHLIKVLKLCRLYNIPIGDDASVLSAIVSEKCDKIASVLETFFLGEII